MQSVADFLTEWVNLRSAGLAPRTIESYNGLISRQIGPNLADIAADQLQPEQVQRLLSGLCAAGHSRTAQLVYILLRAAYSEAVRVGILATDPTNRVLRPRHVASDPRWWSLDEVKTFAQACPSLQFGHAWLLALMCGLRRGELAGLRWSDVDLIGHELHICNQRQWVGGRLIDAPPKSRAGRRSIPYPSLLHDTLARQNRLQRLQQARGAVLPVYVVCGSDNRPVDPHRLNKALWCDIERVGLRQINLHGLRHSMASAAVAAGVDIKVLQSLLGHAHYSTTADIYAHVLHGQQVQAVAALCAAVYT